MTTLFALADQYRQLNALAESETDIPEEVLRDTLEGLTGELQVKAQNVARFIVNQEAMAEAISQAALALVNRSRRLRARNEYMKAYLLMNMQATGISRIESPELVVALKKNPPSVVVFDWAAVPAEFMVQKPPPPPYLDKAAVKEAIKSGIDVPGCRLEQNQRVDIKL